MTCLMTILLMMFLFFMNMAFIKTRLLIIAIRGRAFRAYIIGDVLDAGAKQDRYETLCLHALSIPSEDRMGNGATTEAAASIDLPDSATSILARSSAERADSIRLSSARPSER